MNLIFSLARPWILIMVILLHYRVYNEELLASLVGAILLYTANYTLIMQGCRSIIFLNERLFPV